MRVVYAVKNIACLSVCQPVSLVTLPFFFIEKRSFDKDRSITAAAMRLILCSLIDYCRRVDTDSLTNRQHSPTTPSSVWWPSAPNRELFECTYSAVQLVCCFLVRRVVWLFVVAAAVVDPVQGNHSCFVFVSLSAFFLFVSLSSLCLTHAGNFSIDI